MIGPHELPLLSHTYAGILLDHNGCVFAVPYLWQVQLSYLNRISTASDSAVSKCMKTRSRVASHRVVFSRGGMEGFNTATTRRDATRRDVASIQSWKFRLTFIACIESVEAQVVCNSLLTLIKTEFIFDRGAFLWTESCTSACIARFWTQCSTASACLWPRSKFIYLKLNKFNHRWGLSREAHFVVSF